MIKSYAEGEVPDIKYFNSISENKYNIYKSSLSAGQFQTY